MSEKPDQGDVAMHELMDKAAEAMARGLLKNPFLTTLIKSHMERWSIPTKWTNITKMTALTAHHLYVQTRDICSRKVS